MTLLKNNEAREALPSQIRKLAQEHFESCNGALLIADKAMMQLGHGRLLPVSGTDSIPTGMKYTAEPKAEHSSFWLKVEPHGDYKPDGNTQTPGKCYQLLWLYELVYREPETWRNQFHEWYTGRLSCAIAHEVEYQVRDYDDRTEARGGSLTFGGTGLGPDADHDEKNIRIAYSTHGNTFHVGSAAIANLIENVVKLRERVKLLDAIKPLMPPVER